tara:strand:- start:2550 stop:3302 length:753 start_codon:yes stop_codon:yes gene_type:complete
MNILGVRIDTYAKKEAIEEVRKLLDQNIFSMVFTPNPEMLVAAKKDQYFHEVLNLGKLNICDGIGITLVARKQVEKIPGVDFMQDICAVAEKEGKTVYLLGSGDGRVVEKCAENLQKTYSNLQIVGAHKGPLLVEKSHNGRVVVEPVNAHIHDEIIHDIIMAAPDILFVAFGHGKQEKWIFEHGSSLPSVILAMGVGGSFDYIAGKTKRPPKCIQRVGGEWLWRLIHQPSRIKRIWHATVVFLWYNIIHR